MRVGSICWQFLQAVSLASTLSTSHVVLFDRSKDIPASSNDGISPTTAKLILAQRLGLSDEYSVHSAGPDDIDVINRYGVSQQHSLTGSVPLGLRALLVIEAADDISHLLPHDLKQASFALDAAPHVDDMRDLYDDLVYASHARQSHANFGLVGIKELLDSNPASLNSFRSYGDRVLIWVSSLASITAANGKKSVEYAEEAAKIKAIISTLYEHEDILSGTVVLMPSAKHCRPKLGVDKAFGGVRKRSIMPDKSELLLTAASTDLPHNIIKSSSSANHSYAGTPFPLRFPTKKACEKTTSKCSGHGECRVVAVDASAGHSGEFYGCICKPQVQKLSHGTKTTYYGGAACQKRDVSVPFWLLAGTCLFLVSVVTMGIGLLYSMGADELPSVIGAGVSGPRASK